METNHGHMENKPICFIGDSHLQSWLWDFPGFPIKKNRAAFGVGVVFTTPFCLSFYWGIFFGCDPFFDERLLNTASIFFWGVGFNYLAMKIRITCH